MSKRRLISLILALILVVSLASALISCNRRKPNGNENPVGDNTDPEYDKEWWLSCEHEYDHDCDTDCNKCKEKRLPIAHTYDNDKDTECNLCGYVRTLACDHVYDNACDADCNVCGEARDGAQHIYSNACDTDCNECGAKRTPADHVYDNSCDINCNICGAVRDGGHVFDSPCDADCNRGCGYTRVASEHAYEYECSDACKLCGETRTASHVYDNACDGVCNECGATRQPNHTFSATWTKSETSHWQECTACGAKQNKASHEFTSACDPDCNVCGVTRMPAEHIYDNACDADCNTCGATRTVGAHTNIVTYDETHHWKVCQECGAISDKAAHTVVDDKCACGYKANAQPCAHDYLSDCSSACDLCGEVRVPVADHNYVAKSDSELHWKECTGCGHVKNCQDHTFVEVPVDDTKHKTACVACGYETGAEAPHHIVGGVCDCGYEGSND